MNKLEDKKIETSESTSKSDKNESNINTNQSLKNTSMDTREANDEKYRNFIAFVQKTMLLRH